MMSWLLQNEVLLVMLYGLCLGFVWALPKVLGHVGLCVFVALAVPIANIQVLKHIELSFYQHPVAMGTVVMVSTFLATDLACERYGRRAANLVVLAGFCGMLLFTGAISLTILFQSAQTSAAYAQETQRALEHLFTPSISLFLASLVAYLSSQVLDVYIFSWLRATFRWGAVFTSSVLSTAVSALVDTVVFSLFAWRVFAVVDVDLETLVWTYMLGTYGLRLVLTFLNASVLSFMLR